MDRHARIAPRRSLRRANRSEQYPDAPMKNIKRSYWSLIVGFTLLWLAADAIFFSEFELFAWRPSLINYSGIVAIGVMSIGMMLAIRPLSIEPFLGGLDKTYRLHKWLGITALAVSITHWLWVKAPQWMVAWGWIVRPPRGPHAEEDLAFFRFLHAQRGLAEGIGEWAFYAAVLLIALALWKRFPYRHFFTTHRLLAIVYLLLVFHSLVLMEFDYWREIIGPLLLILMAGGSAAAFVSLFRKVGCRRRAVGVIEELDHHPDNRVLEVAVKLTDRWSGHAAGQFAFVTFDRHEGPHPFTISSAWRGDGRMRFLIKGLGDYTRMLPATLRVGDLLKIEGPYGRFEFDGGKLRQIWVAGGIGITPFVARMQALAEHPESRKIDLFYSTSAPDADFISQLHKHAEAAKVGLHVVLGGKEPGSAGRLNAATICQTVPDWPSADVWFCGPAGFGHVLREDLLARGLAADDFHQELFELR
jgi:predicted ferric reductase